MFDTIKDFIYKSHAPAARKGAEETLERVRDAQHLLAEPKRKKLIDSMVPMLGLAPDQLDPFAHTLIRNIAEFVQLLPETRNSYYAQPGGLLDHALERTFFATKYIRSYFLPHNDDPTAPLTSAQSLWAYTLFSASLLHDMGRVVVDIKLKLLSDKDDHGHQWRPFEGNMLDQNARYYRYHFSENMPEELRRNATLLLARQLIPEDAFHWISGDHDTFGVWLALLQDNTYHSRTFSDVLQRAEALTIIEHYQNMGLSHQMIEHLNQQEGQSFFAGKNVSLDDTIISKDELEKKLREGGSGAIFLSWLKERLKRDAGMINKAGVFIVHGGVLLGPEVFKLFLRENRGFMKQFSQYATVEKLQQAMQETQLTSNRERTFINTKTDEKIQGLLLNNPHVVLSSQITNTFPKALPEVVPLSNAASSQQRYIASDGKLVANPENQKTVVDVQQPNPNPFHR